MPWDGKKLPDALAIGATNAAAAAANGAKNNAYLAYLQGQIGSNFVMKLVRDDVTVWQATASGSLTINASRFVLPTSATQTSITAADIDTGQWILRVESASDNTKYIATAVTPLIGTGPFYLTADLDVGGTLTLGSLVLNSPSFDVASGVLFQTVALTDMRKSGWTGTYADSYAVNTGNLWGRGTGSSQRVKASLTMSRYPMKTTSNVFPGTSDILLDAFVSSRNPDYVLELAGNTSRATQTGTVSRILFWNQIYLDEVLQFNHAPGYTGNTRVMMWGVEVWIKFAGTWRRITAAPPTSTNNFSGEAWSPRFNLFGGVSIDSNGGIGVTSGNTFYQNNLDARIETAPLPTFMSARPIAYIAAGPGQTQTAVPQDAPYWTFHGYAGGVNFLSPNTVGQVEDVLVLQKTALVLHNRTATDDRDFSRFLLACGADWFPDPGVTIDGAANFVPGIGTSKHKYVTAKYPDWQWHVMHTMTEAQFNATNGYPSALTNLVQGDGSVAPPSTDVDTMMLHMAINDTSVVLNGAPDRNGVKGGNVIVGGDLRSAAPPTWWGGTQYIPPTYGPTYWVTLQPWYVVWDMVGHQDNLNVVCALKDLELWWLNQDTNAWSRLSISAAPPGDPFSRDEVNSGGDATGVLGSDGAWWVKISPTGSIYHGYQGQVSSPSFDPAKVLALQTRIKARKQIENPSLADQRSLAQYTVKVGLDVYPVSGAALPAAPNNYWPGAISSRHEELTNDWKTIFATTVTPSFAIDNNSRAAGGYSSRQRITEATLRANPPPV